MLMAFGPHAMHDDMAKALFAYYTELLGQEIPRTAQLRGCLDCSAPVFPAPLHELHHGAAPTWSSWSRCYSIKNMELVEYPLRYSKKNVFLGAEFVELDVFGTVELERSWKNGSRAVPNTP
jgi:hypothetical protein